MPLEELLPPGVYPIWSPFDSDEAAAALAKALADDETAQTPSNNPPELQIALQNLRILEETAAALQKELADANPDLLAAALPAYLSRMASLQADIAAALPTEPLAA